MDKKTLEENASKRHEVPQKEETIYIAGEEAHLSVKEEKEKRTFWNYWQTRKERAILMLIPGIVASIFLSIIIIMKLFNL